MRIPGTEFAKPLYILAAGKPAEGMFSSKEPPPASGTKIRFEAAPGSDLKISPSEAVADAGGLVPGFRQSGQKGRRSISEGYSGRCTG